MDDVNFEIISALRQQNIGRFFMRAARDYSERALAKLHAAGYADLTQVHTALISNLDIEGTRITVLADRAGISKQAMGQLATELEKKGLVTRKSDPNDRRASLICFTDAGLDFLKTAYHIKLEIEGEYTALLGEQGMHDLRTLIEKLIAGSQQENE